MIHELGAGPLAGLRLGLVHGRLKADEKDAVMRRFKGGTYDVLVSTTVIEVGIDVPNATAIVIEHAERFGLAQLHQLRGRVGRGLAPAHCFLVVPDWTGEDAYQRLRTLEQSTDGFRIAEVDLALRGPGDFLGTRQARSCGPRATRRSRGWRKIRTSRAPSRQRSAPSSRTAGRAGSGWPGWGRGIRRGPARERGYRCGDSAGQAAFCAIRRAKRRLPRTRSRAGTPAPAPRSHIPNRFIIR